jgi:acetylornithine deacetylase/succinyl-diaminopimelate desuccinylase-like protein
MSTLDHALARVSVERAAALTFDLVSIASPTGDTAEVSEALAEELRSFGMEVELFRELPMTPVVIGRLRGRGGGRTLILNGHLDTVPIPHADPERRDGRVYGRGTADMKGNIAAGVEAIRAAAEAGLELAGDVLLVAHGLHEAPGGHAEDLIAALQAGAIRGDAALVLEVGADALPVVGLGSGIYTARFHRPDQVTHELMTPAGTPNPILAAGEAALALQAYAVRLKSEVVERAGSESLFLGQIHSGDFFNRFPNEAWLQGTRRYGPEKTAEGCEAEIRGVLQPIAEKHGLALDLKFEKVRDGFRTPEDHPLVGALREAYQAETGRDLPLTGIRIVADAPVFEKVGAIPCLYHGLAGEGAHADVESIPESELERAARVYLRTIFAFCS